MLFPGLCHLCKWYRVHRSQMLLIGATDCCFHTDCFYGNASGSGWVGPKVVLGGVSGNHQGWVNSVSHIYGYSDMVPICQLCQMKAQQSNSSFCQHFCLGETCSFSPHPERKTIHFLLVCPWHLWSCCPHAGPQR